MSRFPFPRWTGVDLDGTLAFYPPPANASIGPPIPAMLARVNGWIAEGRTVRIVTARASAPGQREIITAWLISVGLPPLDITQQKDFGMDEIWDDRAVQVEENTGRRMDGKDG